MTDDDRSNASAAFHFAFFILPFAILQPLHFGGVS
jgi:hypothetical protein